MEYTCCCFLLLVLCSLVTSQGSDDPGNQDKCSRLQDQATRLQDQVTRLQDLVYRQAQDIGSMMADIKTLIMFQSQQQLQNQKLAEDEQKDGIIGGCTGNVTGMRTLHVKEHLMTVTCDGHGWITVLRRVNDEHDFTGRNWEDYKLGFGNLAKSFWLGLENMHLLTSLKAMLKVELEAWDGETRWAQYSYVRIVGESSRYRLMVDGYSGDAGDSMAYHNGMKFSTNDRDNDEHTGNCATNRGGWWYKDCFQSLLTGKYYNEGMTVPKWHGLIWGAWKGTSTSYSYKKAEMKIFIS